MKKKRIAQPILLTLTALALVGVVAACAPPQPPAAAPNQEQPSPTPVQPTPAPTPTLAPEPTLEGVVWRLQSYVDADGVAHPALAEAPVTLSFAGGRVVADTRCNKVNATYRAEGEALSIKLGRMTLRACTEPISSQESGVLGGLRQTARYAIADETLTLMDAAGKMLLTLVR